MSSCCVGTAYCQCNNASNFFCGKGCYQSIAGDCLACPENTICGENTLIQNIQCANGYYLNPAYNNNPEEACLTCPDHALCKQEATLQTLQLEDYFWRASNNTSKIYACDNNSCRYSNSSCTADDNNSCLYPNGSECLAGHSGPLCEVCDYENQYFNRYNYRRCVDCPSYTTVAIKTAVLVHAIIGAAVGIFNLLQLNVNVKTTLSRLNLLGIFKIVVSFYQVAAQLNAVYGIELDPKFQVWYDSFKAITLDAFDITGIPPACIGDMWMRLTVGMAWPYLFTLIVVIGVTLYTLSETIILRKKEKGISFWVTIWVKLWPRLLYFTTIIIYISLPSVSQTIFQALNCKTFATDDEDGTVSYLISDPSLECDRSTSDYATVLHIFFAGVVFSLILTFEVFLFLLMKIRKSVRSKRITALAGSCGFLWRDYTETMMFWDIIDTIRKTFLTGFIMFIDSREGSEKVLRLVVAAILSVLYIGILALARPYKRLDDLYLATISNMILLCCFVAGVILQLCNSDSNENSINSCQKFVGLSLNHYKASIVFFALMVSMLLITFLFSLVHIKNVMVTPSIRLIGSGSKPNLELPKDYTSHAFVSHVWASGQAKTHAIVRKLSLLLPGTKFWLDVDDLTVMDELEKSVQKAAVFVLFYSEGYFRSTNCRRELFAAIDFQKPIILIFQGDEQHVIYEIINECEKHCNTPLFDTLSEKSADMDGSDGFNNALLLTNEFDIEMVESPRSVIPGNKQSNQMSVLDYLLKDEPIRWLDEGAFSAASVRMISERMFSYLPYYSKHPAAIRDGLKVPGEIGPVSLESSIIVLTHNKGSRDIALEVATVLDRSKGSIEILNAATYFSQMWSSFEGNDFEDSEKPTVMFLLYLNKHTFVNGGNPVDNESLSYILKRAREYGIRIVLVHEQVTECGGCPFSLFFRETPQELVDSPYEIYKDIAIPLYGQKEFRTVSLKSILQKMGAKENAFNPRSPMAGILARVKSVINT